MTSDIVTAAYDRIADTYDSAYTRATDRAENQAIKLLIPYKGGFFLDVACGTGLAVDLHQIPSYYYRGLDISHGMLKRFREKYPMHATIQADLDEVGIIPGMPFDQAVCLFGGFNYVDDPERVVRMLHNNLRPGGELTIMAYGPAHERKKSYLFNGNRPPERLYTVNMLQDLFDEAGLTRFRARGFRRKDDMKGTVLVQTLQLLTESMMIPPHPQAEFQYHIVSGCRAN